MLKPALMTGTDLTATIDACAHILGCDERHGTLGRSTRAELEQLLDDAAAEQTRRAGATASRS